MTRDEIIAMAKEAGCVSATFWPDDFTGLMGLFERFAALATAAEREACAQVCDQFAATTMDAQQGPSDTLSNVMLRQVAVLGHGECAAAIRARGAA